LSPKQIALDFDDTYTADPWLWNRFIADAQSRGHVVVVVTSRKDEDLDEIREALPQLEIVNTSGYLKKPAAQQAGFDIDIWIDDMPGIIEGTGRYKAADGNPC
jgi:hypothetical protein